MSAEPIGIGYVPEWTFADRLRKARRQTAMTQRQFAEAIGEDAKAYSQWEAGNNNPRHLVEVCKKVEALTGVSAAWLLNVVPGSGVSASGYRMGKTPSTGSGAIVLGGAARFRPVAAQRPAAPRRRTA